MTFFICLEGSHPGFLRSLHHANRTTTAFQSMTTIDSRLIIIIAEERRNIDGKEQQPK
jgi:hypothetical protein